MGSLPPPDPPSASVANLMIAAISSSHQQNAKLLSLLTGICGVKKSSGSTDRLHSPSSSLTPSEAKNLESLLKSHPALLSEAKRSLGLGSTTFDSISSATSTATAAASFTHPREELVKVMSRIYARTLTTSSGGNCSVKDVHGVVWVTPKGNDKGALKRDEIAYRDATTKEWKGNFPPSSEWPFHTAIFERRDDVGAVLHAHSHTLVAFSVAKELPNTLSLSQTAQLCGPVALAPYAVPGTDALADSIVSQIHHSDCIIMENHGIVVVAPTMVQAFHKFEALEFCARAELGAATLGGRKLLLRPSDVEEQQRATIVPVDMTASRSRPKVTPLECDLREALVKYIRRCYDQGLVHATSGAMSARLGPTSFLITATGVDRHLISPSDIVLVDFAAHTPHFYAEQPDRHPSRAWAVHRAIYAAFPETKSVMHAHPIHITSFCLSSVPFTPNVIPESYIVLRDVGRISFRQSFDPAQVVAAYRDDPETCNILLAENDGVIIRGNSLEQVFDRLEVLEATATVVLEAKTIGRVNLMTEKQQDDVDIMFFGMKTPRQKTKKQKTNHDFGGGSRQDELFHSPSTFNVFKGSRSVGPLMQSKTIVTAHSSATPKRKHEETEGMASFRNFNVYKGNRQVGPLMQHKVMPQSPPPKPRVQTERMDNSSKFNVFMGSRQVGPLMQFKVIPRPPPPRPRVPAESMATSSQFNVYQSPRSTGPLMQYKVFAQPAAEPPPTKRLRIQTESMDNASQFNVYQSPRKTTGPLMQFKKIAGPPPPQPPPPTTTPGSQQTEGMNQRYQFNIFQGSRRVGPLLQHKPK
jgi:L-fuculose-phosphate aldolase